jgi:hypothetical protein
MPNPYCMSLDFVCSADEIACRTAWTTPMQPGWRTKVSRTMKDWWTLSLLHLINFDAVAGFQRRPSTFTERLILPKTMKAETALTITFIEAIGLRSAS